ncbi:hypothetical protein SNOG_11323 [Parastagonospora nodorum SN15]|uniref:Uncharacterized protein n=1 Tax=Phaeosphaeria nodorum (strain SN15 / ATCC MYA-4574 / FGSC 10173) TaxID=321614 RepID=Q0UA91_PHANO|nr:hypothetical protein SNOG_11323 [Parastagonospora nodorum SN15]EAT81031.1 hypothetical protein SNOG_11323 [Parastagonospora nodorum SN15]
MNVEQGLLSLRNLCENTPDVHTLTLPLISRFYGPAAYPALFPFPGCTVPNSRQAIQAPGLLDCSALGVEVQHCQSLGKRVLLSVKGSSLAAVGGNSNFGNPNSPTEPFGVGFGDEGVQKRQIDGFLKPVLPNLNLGHGPVVFPSPIVTLGKPAVGEPLNVGVNLGPLASAGVSVGQPGIVVDVNSPVRVSISLGLGLGGGATTAKLVSSVSTTKPASSASTSKAVSSVSASTPVSSVASVTGTSAGVSVSSAIAAASVSVVGSVSSVSVSSLASSVSASTSISSFSTSEPVSSANAVEAFLSVSVGTPVPSFSTNTPISSVSTVEPVSSISVSEPVASASVTESITSASAVEPSSVIESVSSVTATESVSSIAADAVSSITAESISSIATESISSIAAAESAPSVSDILFTSMVSVGEPALGPSATESASSVSDSSPTASAAESTASASSAISSASAASTPSTSPTVNRPIIDNPNAVLVAEVNPLVTANITFPISSTASSSPFPNLFSPSHPPSSFALTLFSLFGEGHTERADLRPLGPTPPSGASPNGTEWINPILTALQRPLGEEVVVDGFDVQIPAEWKGTYQDGQFADLVSRLRELHDESWEESGGVVGGKDDLGADGKGVVFSGWIGGALRTRSPGLTVVADQQRKGWVEWNPMADM